jgi:hypothetical protein
MGVISQSLGVKGQFCASPKEEINIQKSPQAKFSIFYNLKNFFKVFIEIIRLKLIKRFLNAIDLSFIV